METTTRGRVLTVTALTGLLGLVTALGVHPQLSARLTGDTYRVQVGPVDPIDPFRGAYVQLGYPGLQVQPEWDEEQLRDEEWDVPEGQVFLPLRTEGDLTVSAAPVSQRPTQGPYLTCRGEGWRVRCGIESWFVPQSEARDLERRAARGDLVAVLKVDGRGNAAVVDIE